MDEHDLLHESAAGDHEAFATLAKRYVNLVHGSALRLTGNPHDAQDVCQAVFILLSRKAGTISRNVILSGWLLRATRFAASELRRSQRRRQYHERNAPMTPTQHPPTDDCQAMLPLLDDALARLPEDNRAAILLRYFEGRDYAETAGRLGITEAAARQRVSRAVEQLRAIFIRKGVHVSGAAIGSTLAAHAAPAAPLAAITAAANAPVAAGASVTLANAAQFALTAVTYKTMAVVLAAWFLLGSAAYLLTPLFVKTPAPVVAGVAAVPPPPPPALANAPRPRNGPRELLHRPAYGVSGERIVASGVVRSSDGSPLAGAVVHLATPRRPAWLYWRQYFGGLKQTTTTDGAYAFPPVEDAAFTILVTHPTGIGTLNAAEVKAGTAISLQPWSSIRGTLLSNGQPVRKAKVHLSNWRITSTAYSNQIIRDYSSTTDDDGRFAFPQLAAGEIWLDHELPAGGHCAYKRLILSPGQSADITLGDEGRTVTGTVIPTTRPADWTLDRQHHHSAYLISTAPRAALLPQPLPEETAEQTEARFVQWEQSAEGFQQKRSQFSHGVFIAPDGALLAEAMAPGVYLLVINRYTFNAGTNAWETAETGQRTLTLGANSSPQALGEVQLKPPAPPATAPSIWRLFQ